MATKPKNERNAGRKKLPVAQRRINVSITLPPNLVRSIEALGGKTEIIEKAVIAYLENKTGEIK
jgi:hypothetical protein